MRIRYNAPTVLTFTLLCALIFILLHKNHMNVIHTWFCVPGNSSIPEREAFSAKNIYDWVSILTHVFGHGNWTHLMGNLTLILIIGPMLEENYGSMQLLIMIIITALSTGILNVIFFANPLMGASGVVFMMILLSSFTNFSKGEIPLTFILVLVLYMGMEILKSLNTDNISQFAHIIGGLCGSFFGFFNIPGRRP